MKKDWRELLHCSNGHLRDKDVRLIITLNPIDMWYALEETQLTNKKEVYAAVLFKKGWKREIFKAKKSSEEWIKWKTEEIIAVRFDVDKAVTLVVDETYLYD